MASRIPALLNPPIGFAHRGARAQARENTLEAFALAQRLGATGIETDAWLTADNEIVLDHDGVLRRLGIWRTPIAAVERRQLPSHIPTLTEYYQHCGTALPLSVDLKDPKAFAELLTVARAHEASADLWICHEDPGQLTRWRAPAPEVRLVNSVRIDRVAVSAERRAADLAQARIDAVNMPRQDWNGGLTTLFHRFGVLAFAWDAQHERHIEELFDMGVDAVYSDHVERMVAVLSRQHRNG